MKNRPNLEGLTNAEMTLYYQMIFNRVKILQLFHSLKSIMKHHKKNRIFGRVRSQRTALMKGLVSSLVLHRKIYTTEAKAKELRPLIEKLITRAKTKTLSSRRILTSRVGESAAKRLVDEIAPKYKERNGGYTRITKLETKRSDAAKMAQIEFVQKNNE